MTKQTLSFSRTDSAKFFRTLNKRVNEYFKENNTDAKHEKSSHEEETQNINSKSKRNLGRSKNV